MCSSLTSAASPVAAWKKEQKLAILNASDLQYGTLYMIVRKSTRRLDSLHRWQTTLHEDNDDLSPERNSMIQSTSSIGSSVLFFTARQFAIREFDQVSSFDVCLVVNSQRTQPGSKHEWRDLGWQWPQLGRFTASHSNSYTSVTARVFVIGLFADPARCH